MVRGSGKVAFHVVQATRRAAELRWRLCIAGLHKHGASAVWAPRGMGCESSWTVGPCIGTTTTTTPLTHTTSLRLTSFGFMMRMTATHMVQLYSRCVF